jgi:hypothetical protein
LCVAKPDEAKQLYLEVCSSKEKFLATLECEQKVKKDLATLLDIETEKLKKAQADFDPVLSQFNLFLAFIPRYTKPPLCYYL